MKDINIIEDCESSNQDYIDTICNKIYPKIDFGIPTVDLKETKKAINESVNEELFEKEFKEAFEEENDTKKLPSIINEKTYNSINLQEVENDENYENDEKIDDIFPFTPGIGIKNCLEKLGYIVNYKSSCEISLFPIFNEEEEEKSINPDKIQIIINSKEDNVIIKKDKKERRYKPDDVRKKVKARFHKVLKNVINIRLKKASSKRLFDFLPQYFVADITIKLNRTALNLTYDEIVRNDFSSLITKQEKSKVDIEKYNRNLDVLNYLDYHPEICNISKYSIIRKMKLKKILKAYFSSKEFEETIIDLHNKKEKKEYIEQYVNKSMQYIHYFSKKAKMQKKKKKIFRNNKDDEYNNYDFM